jgi:hypothetical protein
MTSDPRWQWAPPASPAAGWSRTRRGGRGTIVPLVARARGLAGLLPCDRCQTATGQDGIHSLQSGFARALVTPT